MGMIEVSGASFMEATKALREFLTELKKAALAEQKLGGELLSRHRRRRGK